MSSDIWQYVVLPLSGVVVGYLSRLLTTRRERKKSDLDLITESVTPLLNSIRELADQNRELVDKLADEQRSCLEYMKQNKSLLEERAELVSKINKLTRQVDEMKKMLKDYLKDNPLNDN